jgi:hypothetical protein
VKRISIVRGDRVQLQQVILNLLMNAFQAMKDCPLQDREVVVHGEVDGANGILATVRDRGIGLGRDKLDKIFPALLHNKTGWVGHGTFHHPFDHRSARRPSVGREQLGTRRDLLLHPANFVFQR